MFLVLLVGSLAGGGPAVSPPAPARDGEAAEQKRLDLPQLVGKPVGEVLRRARVEYGKHAVADEPPGIARAVQGRTGDGHEIWVYVARGSLPFNEKRDWTLAQLAKLPVSGVAVKEGGKWRVAGEVIPRFHVNRE